MRIGVVKTIGPAVAVQALIAGLALSGCRSAPKSTSPSGPPPGSGSAGSTSGPSGSSGRPAGRPAARPAARTAARPDASAGAKAGGRPGRKARPRPRPVLKQLFRTTPLDGEGERVTALAAGPSILVAGGRRGRVAVLDSATGKRIFTSRKVGKRLVHVFVSGDGSAMMATDAALSNFVWRREAGKFKYYRHWHRKTGRSQALSRSGRILIREDVRKSVRWYELATRKMKELVKARGVAISGDGRRVAVRNLKGEVEVRDGLTGRRLHLVAGVPKEAKMMGLNANGELLVSVNPGASSWVMEVREVKTGSVRHKVGPVPGKAEGLAVSGTAPVAVARTSKGLAVVVLNTGTVVLQVSQRFALATVYGYRVFAVPASGPAHVQGFAIMGVGGQPGSAGAGARRKAPMPSTTEKNTGN